VTRLAHTRLVVLAVSLACVCMVGAALPAAGVAQVTNDHYQNWIGLNQPGSALPGTASRPNDENTLATVQGGEIIGCVRPPSPEVSFDSTVWYRFFPHRPGVVRVVADSPNFTAVVAVVPVGAGDVPDNSRYRCAVASLGTAILDYEFPVQEGATYAIQVGSANVAQGLFSLNLFFNADSDRDGLVDSQDACPNESGGSATGGCPDTDGDGVIDRSDRCPGAKGTAPRSGCPDADGDGKIDPDDVCKGESTRGKRDRNDNGCPDLELLTPETILIPGSFCTGSVCHGVRVNKLIVSSIPRGTRVSVSCTKHACKKAKKKAGKSKHVRFFHGKNLRAGVGLTISMTRKGYLGRQLTYWIQANDLKKTSLHCLKSGKPVRCTPRLRVR
jgi:hypothetical protein